jgi:hypothetical protein
MSLYNLQIRNILFACMHRFACSTMYSSQCYPWTPYIGFMFFAHQYSRCWMLVLFCCRMKRGWKENKNDLWLLAVLTFFFESTVLTCKIGFFMYFAFFAPVLYLTLRRCISGHGLILIQMLSNSLNRKGKETKTEISFQMLST